MRSYEKKRDKCIRLGLDFALLQTALRILKEIDLEESEVPFKDDFADILTKLSLTQDVMYEVVVNELVDGVSND